MSQLLRSRRFGPFFATQFLGAFNDNVFKNALVLTIAFHAVSEAESGFWTNLAAGLFILPFFLFSPLAGQLADRFDKAKVARIIKLAEIAIMVVAAFAFWAGWQGLLVLLLFMMGCHSAFFGPVKYSILPQHLKSEELMEGTGLVEMGTFVAILLGTVLGGVIIKFLPEAAGPAVVLFAVLGYLTSRNIPEAPPSDPSLKITLNPVTEFKNLWTISRRQSSIFLSIMGISWFWFVGAIVLAQLPTFVKHNLHGDELIVTSLLAVFTLSIALGSIASSKLSHQTIELGLVPIGALGISLFAGHMGLIDYSGFQIQPFSLAMIMEQGPSLVQIQIIIDFFLLGFFSSFFIVPLYALIQQRSDPKECSRVIAANNILNSLFMVVSAVSAMGFYAAGLKTAELFFVLALMNLAVSAYIFALLPEFVLRFGAWFLAKSVYSLSYHGREHVPSRGPFVLVANHVSFIDWLIISAACQRPIRFVMDHRIFKMPVISWLFRLSQAIPIAPAKEDPAAKAAAFAAIKDALASGEVVCIFPEGKITFDGAINPFQRGIEKILTDTPVPVVPMALGGLWGSFFSRKGGAAMQKMPRPSRRRIRVAIGAPIPTPLKAEDYQSIVSELLPKPLV